jgi:glycine oxidase
MSTGAVDVTVRGAGILGLAAAWSCALRGARVRVIDPGGVGAGASGGIVGALSPLAPDAARWDEEHRLQLESLLMAEEFWTTVQTSGGIDPGYARVGRLLPLRDEAAVAEAERRSEAARALWHGRAAWSVVRLYEAPLAPLSPSGLHVHETLAARIDPRRALAALAAAIRAQGGEVVREGREEGRVIEATGAAGLLAQGLGGPVKGQAARLLLPHAGDLAHANLVHVGGLFVVPHADGTVAVGSTSEPDRDDPGPDERLDAVLERARALVPRLGRAEVIERWAGLRPRAASGRLLLGMRDGRVLLNGGFRTGFGLAPLAGLLAAGLALDDFDKVPPGWRL